MSTKVKDYLDTLRLREREFELNGITKAYNDYTDRMDSQWFDMTSEEQDEVDKRASGFS